MSKKQVQVLILPTKDEVLPGLLKYDNSLLSYKAGGELRKKLSWGAGPQHLYFTSNGEIKEGDWYYYKVVNKLIKCKLTKEDIKYNHRPKSSDGSFKVIATTDKSLNLPLIPQSFIDRYVKSNGQLNTINVNAVTLECEEQKQTLEEAAKEYFDTLLNIGKELTPMDCVLFGAKWQQSNS